MSTQVNISIGGNLLLSHVLYGPTYPIRGEDSGLLLLTRGLLSHSELLALGQRAVLLGVRHTRGRTGWRGACSLCSALTGAVATTSKKKKKLPKVFGNGAYLIAADAPPWCDLALTAPGRCDLQCDQDHFLITQGDEELQNASKISLCIK